MSLCEGNISHACALTVNSTTYGCLEKAVIAVTEYYYNPLREIFNTGTKSPQYSNQRILHPLLSLPPLPLHAPVT